MYIEYDATNKRLTVYNELPGNYLLLFTDIDSGKHFIRIDGEGTNDKAYLDEVYGKQYSALLDAGRCEYVFENIDVKQPSSIDFNELYHKRDPYTKHKIDERFKEYTTTTDLKKNYALKTELNELNAKINEINSKLNKCITTDSLTNTLMDSFIDYVRTNRNPTNYTDVAKKYLSYVFLNRNEFGVGLRNESSNAKYLVVYYECPNDPHYMRFIIVYNYVTKTGKGILYSSGGEYQYRTCSFVEKTDGTYTNRYIYGDFGFIEFDDYDLDEYITYSNLGEIPEHYKRFKFVKVIESSDNAYGELISTLMELSNYIKS